jgi:hypothetical protein
VLPAQEALMRPAMMPLGAEDTHGKSHLLLLFRNEVLSCYCAGIATTGRVNDMGDGGIRAALDRHWAASDADDFDAEHDIYCEDAVLEYPQSGERIRGRRNIQASRAAQPNKKRFAVRRIIGAGDIWVTEYVLSYDGRPSFTVSIMEFADGKVARETQYFGAPFAPGASRAQFVAPPR